MYDGQEMEKVGTRPYSVVYFHADATFLGRMPDTVPVSQLHAALHPAHKRTLKVGPPAGHSITYQGLQFKSVSFNCIEQMASVARHEVRDRINKRAEMLATQRTALQIHHLQRKWHCSSPLTRA